MADLPKPPISRDVDLRDFRFMPLDVVRLRDSDLALTASAEGVRAAVLLWCAAWHQVPAGSLPNDDKAIARLAGCDADAMHRIRDEALHGFALHSDGRLYHPVVVEKAIEAWEEKQRYRTAARKRWKDKRKGKNATHERRMEDASCETDKTHMQGTGTGTGTGIKEQTKSGAEAPAADAASPDLSDQRTQLYHRGKQVLGKSAGGQITRLLAGMDNNVARARSAIETASTKTDPAEYIAAVIRHCSEEAAEAEKRPPLNPVLTL